jgi:hypothetical protein
MKQQMTLFVQALDRLYPESEQSVSFVVCFGYIESKQRVGFVVCCGYIQSLNKE